MGARLITLHSHVWPPCADVLAYVRGTTVSKKTNATLAEYLYEVTPYARFIVLLRDPVQRCVAGRAGVH